MPELRHPRTLLAVAAERNFTRAAQRLHIAQPAVSKAIAQLERELGFELLERTTRDVRLTAAGEALYERAQAIVAAADEAFAQARDHGVDVVLARTVERTPGLEVSDLAPTPADLDGRRLLIW